MSAGKKDPVGELLYLFIVLIIRLIKNVFWGIRSLNSAPKFLGFAAAIMLAAAGYCFKAMIFSIEVHIIARIVLYAFLLSLPALYLLVAGQIKYSGIDKYAQIFKDIGFAGRDKKTPRLVNVTETEKKKIYTFVSNIPLSRWRKAKDSIETGLDCSIRAIREGKNKRTVELVTVPSDYKIPKNILWNDSYILKSDSEIIVGESDLNYVSFDLNRTPHVLAAGETGSGKSVVLRTMLWQMINKGSRVIMIDFKGGVEFGKPYERFGEVITDRNEALKVLNTLVSENTERLKLFRDLDVKNLKEYNEKTGSNLCRIGVFIDEIAEMLDKKGVSKQDKIIFEKLEGALSTLARLSRATGINLFLGVQRPDANVLTGQIKNNIPVRISGRFADKSASEIVLGNTDACELPDIKGRFLYKVGNETIEFQAFNFQDDKMLHEVEVTRGRMLTDDNWNKSFAEPAYKEQRRESNSRENSENNASGYEDDFDSFGAEFDDDDDDGGRYNEVGNDYGKSYEFDAGLDDLDFDYEDSDSVF